MREVLAYYLWRVEGVVVDTSGADPDDVEPRCAPPSPPTAPRPAPAAVSEHLIDTFACAGTVDDVIEQLAAFADAGLDLPLAWHTLGPDPHAALELLAGPVRSAGRPLPLTVRSTGRSWHQPKRCRVSKRSVGSG